MRLESVACFTLYSAIRPKRLHLTSHARPPPCSLIHDSPHAYTLIAARLRLQRAAVPYQRRLRPKRSETRLKLVQAWLQEADARPLCST